MLSYQQNDELVSLTFVFFWILLKTPPKRHTKFGGFKKSHIFAPDLEEDAGQRRRHNTRRRQGQEKGIKRGNIREEHPLLIDI